MPQPDDEPGTTQSSTDAAFVSRYERVSLGILDSNTASTVPYAPFMFLRLRLEHR